MSAPTTEVSQEFLIESFKTIRIQAFAQALEIISSKLGETSDPRIIVKLMDDFRNMIQITKEGKF